MKKPLARPAASFPAAGRRGLHANQELSIGLLPARPFQALMWALPAETISGAKRRDLSRGEQIGD
jgi:hypothetical protein